MVTNLEEVESTNGFVNPVDFYVSFRHKMMSTAKVSKKYLQESKPRVKILRFLFYSYA